MSRGAIRFKIRPTLIADLSDMLPMRKADSDEILASDRDPSQALYDSYSASWPNVFSILVDDKVSGVFGIAQGHSDCCGVPWMLGNDNLVTIPRDLIVESRHWVAHFNRLYLHLENYVDDRNVVSIRWLKALGFVFDKDPIALPNGHVFRRFTRDV
jgi:hypothetical protein